MPRWRPALLRWSLTVLAVALLLVWAISSILLMSDSEYRADGGYAWMIGYGGFGARTWAFRQAVEATPPLVLNLLQIEVGQNRFWFEWHRHQAPAAEITQWFVPAWAPVVIVMIPAAWLWRRRYIERRADNRKRRGLCPACAYARSGLDRTTLCPECGNTATQP